MLSGRRPYLLKEDISWNRFIADRDLIQCNHQPHEAVIRTFIEANLDIKLRNVLKDLHAFACISNLAYETTCKLSPDTYNEIMISLLYRFTHLSFENDPLQESLRTGLLAFSSAIFLQRNFMGHPYDHLLDMYSNALFNLYKSTDVALPVPIVLWLTMMINLVAHKEFNPEEWQGVWLDKTIEHAGLKSWYHAREMLKSFVWIDFVHDRPGKQTFEAAIFRLQKAAEFTFGTGTEESG